MAAGIEEEMENEGTEVAIVYIDHTKDMYR